MAEVWRACPGFEDFYEVSSLGQVRRALYAKKCPGTRPGKVLKPWFHTGGAPAVTLSVKQVLKRTLVPPLICAAWHGPKPTPDHQAAHWDGDVKNNIPGNLRWATRKENEHDKIRHGRYNHAPPGSRHKDAKLHETDIPIIKKLHASGLHHTKIAAKYGVDESTIRCVIKGSTWKHV